MRGRLQRQLDLAKHQIITLSTRGPTLHQLILTPSLRQPQPSLDLAHHQMIALSKRGQLI
jgi:hypothetical protein